MLTESKEVEIWVLWPDL